ncbi:Vacuolar amino acid transporter 3 [Diplonema papillatum]|nr:Vacuolar amino acid transporter 3 [Diplonema papillatum]
MSTSDLNALLIEDAEVEAKRARGYSTFDTSNDQRRRLKTQEPKRADSFGVSGLRRMLKQPGGMRKHYIRARGPALTGVYMGFAGERLSDEDDDSEEDEDYDDETSPLRRGDLRAIGEHNLTSNSQAFFTMLKAIIGSGILFLPRAFADGGIVFATISQVLIAGSTGFCVMQIIEARGDSTKSYADLGHEAFGWFGKRSVQVCLVTFQLGLIVSYFIFVSDTLLQVAQKISACAPWSVQLQPATLIFAHAVIQLPLALVRNLRSLSVLATLGYWCVAVGIFFLLLVFARTLYATGAKQVPLFEPSSAALFIGTSVLSFEGVAVMIPIKESMANPQDFRPVFINATIVVCFLYTIVGLLGTLAYGTKTQQNILLNMGEGSSIDLVVSVLYSIAIVFSLPLQAFPAYRVLERGFPSGKNNPSAKWTKNVLRTSILFTLAVLAVVGLPYLHYIVPVLGGVAGIPIGFIAPCAIHYKLVGTTPGLDIFFTITGVFLAFLVTGYAIYAWMYVQDVALPPLCPA